MSVSVPPELTDKLDEMAGDGENRSSIIRELVREEYERRQNDDDVDRGDGIETDGGRIERERAVALLEDNDTIWTTARSTSGSRTVHASETCRYVERGQKKPVTSSEQVPIRPKVCKSCAPAEDDEDEVEPKGEPELRTDGGRDRDMTRPVSDAERMDRARSSAQALVEWAARAGVNPVTVLREELEDRDDVDLLDRGEGEVDVFYLDETGEEGSA